MSNANSGGITTGSPRSRSAFLAFAAVMWAVMLIPAPVSAQLITTEPPVSDFPAGLAMESTLWEAEKSVLQARAAGLTTTRIDNALSMGGFQARGGGVVVEIVGPEDSTGSPDLTRMQTLGGTVTGQWMNRTEAEIPAEALSAVARTLPDGWMIMRAPPLNYDDVVGQGPAAVNSDSYTPDGAGITIAVIDGGYQNLTAAENNGDSDPAAVRIDYSGGGAFETGGTHGTGCVEAAYDHAPAATWRIYKVNSVTDVGTVVANSIANGVDIISHSLSWYNLGWNDNTGAACMAANNASANGIIFFTSAGNRADSHWEGTMFGNGNAWHDWVAGDETINITIGGFGGGGNFYLSWDTTGGTYDYDLVLYDSTLSTVVASSTNSGNTFESFGYTNPGATATFHLAVRNNSGTTTTFEVFTHNAGTWQQFAVASGSVTSPSNATGGNVLSVGAVDWSQFGSASGTTGINESYSSQGPSNSGMTLPDITGPTNTTGFTYAFGFGGTSSATPNAAGATAAFWSHATYLGATGTRWLINEQARIFRDWGTGAQDNIYGWGGMQLHDYQFGTRWVDRRLGNVGGSAALPYYYVSDAQTAAVTGSRTIFLGQTYSEPVVLNKAQFYDTLINSALLGQ